MSAEDETFYLVTTFLNGPPDAADENVDLIQYHLYGTLEPKDDHNFTKVSRVHVNGRKVFFYCVTKTPEIAQAIKRRMDEMINRGIYEGNCDEIAGNVNLKNTIRNYKLRFYG